MSWLITGSEKTIVDPQFTSVSLLLHGDGTNGSTTIVDSSRLPKTVTAFGNAQISTAQSKFGGASIAFDGTGDYLQTASSSALALGAGDFTVEAWVWFGSVVSNFGRIVQCGNFNTGGDWQLVRWQSTNPAQPTFDAGGIGGIRIQSSITVPQNTWAHIAVTRSGGTIRLFVNGVIGGSATSVVGFTQSIVTVGASATGGESHNGYIDDLRITQGVARYTANFTPPTAPFPDI